MGKFFEWSKPSSRTYNGDLYREINNCDISKGIKIFQEKYGFKYVVDIKDKKGGNIFRDTQEDYKMRRWGCSILKGEFTSLCGDYYFFKDKEDAVLFALTWK